MGRGTLVLVSEGDGNPFIVLTEAHSLITVETDDRGVYKDVKQDGTLSVLVRDRGRAPQTDVTLYLWEYQYVTCKTATSLTQPPTLTLVEDGPPLEHRVGFLKTHVFPANTTTPVSIPYHTLRPGAAAIAFTLDGEPLEGDYPWGSAYYAGIRVMPDDDFSNDPPRLRTSWAYMYEKVFRFYYLIYPGMRPYINFSDEQAVRRAAHFLLTYTDPRPIIWNNTNYMPPSRDLSTGKRKLIVDWVNEVLAKEVGIPKLASRHGTAT